MRYLAALLVLVALLALTGGDWLMQAVAVGASLVSGFVAAMYLALVDDKSATAWALAGGAMVVAMMLFVALVAPGSVDNPLR